MSAKCEACGSTRVEAATIEGAAIRLERSSTLKKVFNTGGVIRCDVCVECGAIGRLRGDAAALREMLPEG